MSSTSLPSRARSSQPPSPRARAAQAPAPEALSAVSFTISPRGPFSLAEAAAFGFGQRDGRDRDGVMRLAFCLDGYTDQVGVEVRQDATGDVHA